LITHSPHPLPQPAWTLAAIIAGGSAAVLIVFFFVLWRSRVKNHGGQFWGCFSASAAASAPAPAAGLEKAAPRSKTSGTPTLAGRSRPEIAKSKSALHAHSPAGAPEEDAELGRASLSMVELPSLYTKSTQRQLDRHFFEPAPTRAPAAYRTPTHEQRRLGTRKPQLEQLREEDQPADVLSYAAAQPRPSLTSAYGLSPRVSVTVVLPSSADSSPALSPRKAPSSHHSLSLSATQSFSELPLLGSTTPRMGPSTLAGAQASMLQHLALPTTPRSHTHTLKPSPTAQAQAAHAQALAVAQTHMTNKGGLSPRRLPGDGPFDISPRQRPSLAQDPGFFEYNPPHSHSPLVNTTSLAQGRGRASFTDHACSTARSAAVSQDRSSGSFDRSASFSSNDGPAHVPALALSHAASPYYHSVSQQHTGMPMLSPVQSSRSLSRVGRSSFSSRNGDNEAHGAPHPGNSPLAGRSSFGSRSSSVMGLGRGGTSMQEFGRNSMTGLSKNMDHKDFYSFEAAQRDKVRNRQCHKCYFTLANDLFNRIPISRSSHTLPNSVSPPPQDNSGLLASLSVIPASAASSFHIPK
jgi:hypothetical protein